MPEHTIHGYAADKFGAVRDAFAGNLSSGADVGASCCVTVEGETVVDLWGGSADAAQTRPWEQHTIASVFSTTKTMTALTALLIADRGELDFDAPVARYWPEFAANGKAGIKVSHVMSHASGLSGWTTPLKTDDLYDWEKMTSLLAAQAPLWEPGTASGYHMVTFGYLIGEVVRRITGRSLGTVFREEIAAPLHADFHIGLPASEDARVAETIPWAPSSQPVDKSAFSEIQAATYFNMPFDAAATIRTRAWRAAEIPAVNGFGNARSVAEIHCILANGGVAKGHRFMSDAGCRAALRQQIEGPDLVMSHLPPARFGLGFALPGPLLAMELPNPNTIHWGGGGCSWVFIDMDARTTLAYAANKMDRLPLSDPRPFRVLEAMAACLPAYVEPSSVRGNG
ncbi:serine hydrolase domain-containing protein [Burkholderia alba]|uniref:serine hydrolase domain-containing protein n=1 Tax=Burkholderia alba TaxID=2683677 RepID=UPI002B05CF80|nr:serine hydrolase domain-containing protein [Burkholderia alba]